MTEFLADGPDWHLGSKVVSSVWRSLITCGDVCSDVTEVTMRVQDREKVGVTLVDWKGDTPLRADSASLKSLESFNTISFIL